jgi:hypothetical protein
MNIQGKLKVKNDSIQVSEKFTKREFVITDDASMYPQDILFQLVNDKCNLIDSVSIGETIDVSFNLRGKLWVSPQGEEKYFNTLEAWKIEKVTSLPAQGIPQQAPPTGPVATGGGDMDDLPFG